MTSPRRAVLFDLDGTLIDSLEDIAASVTYTRAALGLGPLPLEVVRRSIGDGLPKLLERTLPTGADPIASAARFRCHYGAHCLERTYAYEGIPELLVALERAGCAMAVCTNKPAAFSARILEGLGLAHHFGAVIGGDSLPVKKPDPDVLREALRRLGADPSNGAVMVGDGPADVRAAKAFGIPAIAVTFGIADPEAVLPLGPDHVAADVPQLGRLLLGEG